VSVASYDYAIVRVVPRVERGECFNVGVIVYARTQRYLAARLDLDAARLRALAPALDDELVVRHLASIGRICEGGPGTGPIGQLPQPERFHWLVAPRSAVVQTSPVHSGLASDPAQALEHLFGRLVGLALPPQ
jgi:hypothetical protein